MIPKIIHYCNFGGGKQSDLIKKCRESWNVHLKDYTFMEWNEEGFPVDDFQFTKVAYKKKKYAFVSDYVRLWALLKYGGIYLDTDVEVFKPFDDLLDCNVLLGFESENFVATSLIGAKKDSDFISSFFDMYEDSDFAGIETNVIKLNALMKEDGFRLDGKAEMKAGVHIYPMEYFSPKTRGCKGFTHTENTYCVHHYAASWLPWYIKLEESICRLLGVSCRGWGYRLSKFLSR